jgi:hypothetical protein
MIGCRVGDKLETMDLNAVLRRFARLKRWQDACVVSSLTSWVFHEPFSLFFSLEKFEI